MQLRLLYARNGFLALSFVGFLAAGFLGAQSLAFLPLLIASLVWGSMACLCRVLLAELALLSPVKVGEYSAVDMSHVRFFADPTSRWVP